MVATGTPTLSFPTRCSNLGWDSQDKLIKTGSKSLQQVVTGWVFFIMFVGYSRRKVKVEERQDEGWIHLPPLRHSLSFFLFLGVRGLSLICWLVGTTSRARNHPSWIILVSFCENLGCWLTVKSFCKVLTIFKIFFKITTSSQKNNPHFPLLQKKESQP